MSQGEQVRHYPTPEGAELDDAATNLRGYLATIDLEKLREYQPSWTDEELMAWEPNFKNDETLLIVCCSRDVEVDEYREALEELLRSKGLL